MQISNMPIGINIDHYIDTSLPPTLKKISHYVTIIKFNLPITHHNPNPNPNDSPIPKHKPN